jgi:hypothetical protein
MLLISGEMPDVCLHFSPGCPSRFGSPDRKRDNGQSFMVVRPVYRLFSRAVSTDRILRQQAHWQK